MKSKTIRRKSPKARKSPEQIAATFVHDRSRSRRTTSSRQAPAGLAAIFSAIQTAAVRDFHGPMDPSAYIDVPRAIERMDLDSHALSRAIAVAADRQFPTGKHRNYGFGPDGDLKASEHAETAAYSAFWAGVVVCWHTMSVIAGNGGVR